MRKIFLGLFAASLILGACSEKKSEEKIAGDSFDMSSVKKAIDSSNLAFADAAVKGDSAALAACYGNDAVVFAPNAPAMPPSTFAGAAVKMGAKAVTLTATNLYGSADLVAEEGNYVIKGEGDALMEKGKYIVLWKKYDGAWKIFRDCFNSDDPPPAH